MKFDPDDEVIYIFLPLAHVLTRLVQLLGIDRRCDARVLASRPEEDRRRRRRDRADAAAVGAAGVREDLHGGDEQGRGGRRREEEALLVGGRRRAQGARAPAQGRPQRRAARRAVQARREARPAQGARPLRRPDQARDDRCGADRRRHPLVLPCHGRVGARGLRDDRDVVGRDAQHDLRAPAGERRQGDPGLRAAHRRGRRGAHARVEHLQGLLQRRGGDRRDARRRLAALGRPRRARRATATSRSPAARRTSSSRRAARTSRRRTSRTR